MGRNRGEEGEMKIGKKEKEKRREKNTREILSASVLRVSRGSTVSFPSCTAFCQHYDFASSPFILPPFFYSSVSLHPFSPLTSITSKSKAKIISPSIWISYSFPKDTVDSFNYFATLANRRQE